MLRLPAICIGFAVALAIWLPARAAAPDQCVIGHFWWNVGKGQGGHCGVQKTVAGLAADALTFVGADGASFSVR